MDAPYIIKALGGPAKIAGQLGIPANTVAYWRHRNSIPSNRWLAVSGLEGAREAGVTPATLAAAFAAQPSEAA